MPDSTLRTLVLTRLDAETQPHDAWPALVLAALDGKAALEDLLAAPPKPEAAATAKSGGAKPATAQSAETAATASATATAIAEATTPTAAPKPATGSYLRAITVEGFRGIGPPATLAIEPGPGLTLVVGRNGSGKSSFAEALELLMTGDTFRWSQRSKVWREGWRNLHHPKAHIKAELLVEGEKAPCALWREWGEGTALDQAQTAVQVTGKPKTTLDALGWKAPLETYRPFLSYNELGSLLDEGPSKLYDALAGILGLEELVSAQTALRDARTSRDTAQKAANTLREQMIAALTAKPDERAQAVAKALGQKDWGLDEAEAVLSGTAQPQGEDSTLDLLRKIANLQGPDPKTTAEVVQALRDAAARQKTSAGTLAARSDALATLLDHALRFHTDYGDGPCPVCGRKEALDPKWHKAKADEAKALHDAAREATAARQAAEQASKRAQSLPAPQKSLLTRAKELGLASDDAAAALDLWTKGLDTADPQTLADHLEQAAGPLNKALTQLKAQATDQLAAKDQEWRPLVSQIAQWLPQARDARKAAESVPLIKKAESWLKSAAEDIRSARFAPIADHAIRIWEELRVQSHVTLGSNHLGGTATSRRVDLDVTVDGTEGGAALGVMSQGELHSLALSLFIPRATLPESPFRFIVVDDPVQSMDPARVDGLARVLQSAARDRQVVVFTHDDRLPESVRRLGIAAVVVEVTRRENSVVELRPAHDPIKRYIDDALTVVKTDGLPQDAARRVVPGLCREAVEAACQTSVRRRRIGRGEPRTDVEDLLQKEGKLTGLAALALFDDPARAGDVMARLNKENPRSADVFRWCNAGAHEAQPGDLLDKVRDAEKLARWLESQK